MNKIIVEVGSTCTKIDRYNGKQVERVEEVTIFFKKNYSEKNEICESDFEQLVNKVNALKEEYTDICVFGTSIFRTLSEEQTKDFLQSFKQKTGCDFQIISQERENELTVKGATRFIQNKACVFIGGGGSTEISIYDKEIMESCNTSFGVMDVMQVFPDLAEDLASSSLEEVKNYIRERLRLPKEKSSILILAGGGHEKFARYSGIQYEENSLYSDDLAPIMMDMETRERETKRYYKQISLDEIKKHVQDPDWWYATRVMCAFVLVVAEEIEAKYIVPTNIGMVYGILKEQEDLQ